MNDVNVMTASLRCFAFGLLSFVPVAGLVCGILSVAAFMQSSTEQSNPARGYARCGIIFSAIGLFTQATIIAGCVLLAVMGS